MGFLGGLVIGLVLLIIILGLALLIMMNRTNEQRYADSRRTRRPRFSESCCLDVPCSEKCAQRLQSVRIAGAVDAARSGQSMQHLLSMAEDLGLPSGQARTSRHGGDAGSNVA
jgi:hypothetical protein